MELLGRETELASVDGAIEQARAGGSRALGLFGEAGIGKSAAAIFLSEKTIEHHLSRIYAKLGVRSRVELAARLAR